MQKDTRIRYSFNAIRDLFLLGDSTFFMSNGDGYYAPQKMKEILGMILTIAQPDDAANIRDTSSTTQLSIGAAFVENGGGYMVHSTYEHNGQKKFSMAALDISTMQTADGAFPCYSVHFLLSGDVIDGNNQGSPILMVNHTTCRAILDSGETVSLFPHNLESFNASLCYGRTLLKQLVSGHPINIRENQFWLQSHALQAAAGELEHYLSVKTRADLLAEIAFDKLARNSAAHAEQFPSRFPN